MIEGALAKVFGTKHDREIKAIRPLVAAINDLEPQMKNLSDADLAARTQDFKQRVSNGAISFAPSFSGLPGETSHHTSSRSSAFIA